MIRDVAIAGGGPAGALCGERLAQWGFRVTIFDERLAWEKPCGGGLTHKAIQAYPFLLDEQHPKTIVREAELISSGGARTRFRLDRPIVIYARQVLNALLLKRAEMAGCRVVRARVTGTDVSDSQVRLATTQKEPAQELPSSADFVVIAAGARNALLEETTPLQPADLEITVGYFVPTGNGSHHKSAAAGNGSPARETDGNNHGDAENLLKVKFLPDFEGYLWSFPRTDHLSVGICGKMSQNSSAGLRNHLHQFMKEECVDSAAGKFYSHVLPSPQASTLRKRRAAGRRWALIGDAAAWVDPVTGEGLYYAMRSGELLAECLREGKPEAYPARARREFAADLAIGARIARRLYRGRFLGGRATERMIQFAGRSETFRALLRDLFSGAQDYRSLKRRLWGQLGVTLTEIVASLLHSAPETQSESASG